MPFDPITFPVLAVSAAFWLLLSNATRSKKRGVDERLQKLNELGSTEVVAPSFSDFVRNTLPKVGEVVAPTDGKERNLLKSRLQYAGLYQSKAMHVFMGVKAISTFVPIVAIGACYLAWADYRIQILFSASVAGILGALLPGLWLDRKGKKRQMRFRRALPDALDLMVICLEGGTSLQVALQRVSDVLGAVHRELTLELAIVNRGIQMGMSPGAAMKEFADRAGLEELRRLAGVISESERLGGGMTQTLRRYAETLRQQRTQRAEEMAQKAAVKVMIPTVLLIFPAMFVVILGPAAIRIANTLLKV